MKNLKRDEVELTDSQINQAKKEILHWLQTDAEQAMELIMDCYLRNDFEDIINAVEFAID